MILGTSFSCVRFCDTGTLCVAGPGPDVCSFLEGTTLENIISDFNEGREMEVEFICRGNLADTETFFEIEMFIKHNEFPL